MNIYVQCCALAIMVVLLLFYIRQKKVGLYSEKAFFITMVANTIAVVVDIFSYVLIGYYDTNTNLFAKLVCKLHLVSILWVAVTLLAYVLLDVYTKQQHSKEMTKWLIIAGVLSIVIGVLPIKIVTDAQSSYITGAGVIVAYLCAGAYLALSFVLLINHSNQINPRRFKAVFIWVCIWAVAALVEVFNHHLLLVSFACSLGIVILYFSLENPDSNLDRNFESFNAFALDNLIRERLRDGVPFGMLMISLEGARKGQEDDIVIDGCIRRIIEVLEFYPRCRVFKNLNHELIIVYYDNADLESSLREIRSRFYVEGTAAVNLSEERGHIAFPVSLFVAMPDSTLTDDIEVLRKLFQKQREINRDNLSSHLVYLNKDYFDSLKERDTIIREIRRALDEDRVEVFFQPIYSVEDKAFVSAEALARIRRKDQSIVPPGKFIPVAEETGLILPLGERVFRKTCEFLQSGVPTKLGVRYVEVNLSVVQCEQSDLANLYIGIMKEYGIDPKMINLEITETATIQAQQKLKSNMHELIDFGVEFSLDDFGNGHSNLDYVIDMPVDIVKLDMSLIQAYYKEKKARAVVKGAVKMVHDMDLHVLTEGVETREQLEEMERIGVHYIQGYYFSKPLPVREYVEFLRTHREEEE